MNITIRSFDCATYLCWYGYTQGPDVVFHRKYPFIAEIQKVVAEHYGLDRSDMCSSRRAQDVARPRQVAMYLSRRLTLRSLPEIGRRFGNRDHTTVMHACRRIEQLSATDPELATSVKIITRELCR